MLRIFQQLGVYFLLTVWSYAVQAGHPTPANEHERVNDSATAQVVKAETATHARSVKASPKLPQ